MNEEERKEFKELTQPLVDWFCKHKDPHIKIIIDLSSVELVESYYKENNSALKDNYSSTSEEFINIKNELEKLTHTLNDWLYENEN